MFWLAHKKWLFIGMFQLLPKILPFLYFIDMFRLSSKKLPFLNRYVPPLSKKLPFFISMFRLLAKATFPHRHILALSKKPPFLISMF